MTKLPRAGLAITPRSVDPARNTTGGERRDRIYREAEANPFKRAGTPLVHARRLGKMLGLERLYLKLESHNPTGTHKDRVACRLVADALQKRSPGITLATCGNLGAAVSFIAGKSLLPCQVLIPRVFQPTPSRLRLIEAWGAHILRVDGRYEDAVEMSRRVARSHGWYDANPGGPSYRIQFDAYHPIAAEIIDVLGMPPEFLALPVSNGTALVGIGRGFQQLAGSRPQRMPRLVAGSSHLQNPIVESIRSNTGRYRDLAQLQDLTRFCETEINESLVNVHAFDGEEAVTSILNSDGFAVGFPDEDFVQMAKQVLSSEKLDALPAAAAGLLALRHLRATGDVSRRDLCVAIITGGNGVPRPHSRKLRSERDMV